MRWTCLSSRISFIFLVAFHASYCVLDSMSFCCLQVMNLIGDVKGKVAVMLDDMIDTAGGLDYIYWTLWLATNWSWFSLLPFRRDVNVNCSDLSVLLYSLRGNMLPSIIVTLKFVKCLNKNFHHSFYINFLKFLLLLLLGTIAKGAALLHDVGAREVYACCSHAVFR